MMQLNNTNRMVLVPAAQIFIPQYAERKDPATPTEVNEALSRTTHLAFGCHHDDIAIMAFDGVAQCYRNDDQWFTGVTVTDGSASPKKGQYSCTTPEEMSVVRAVEEKRAGYVGEYSAVVLMGYQSRETKGQGNIDRDLVNEDTKEIITATNPDVVYIHNIFDKHDTHVATAVNLLAVLRGLPADQRPAELYACEVWKDLDWLPDKMKVSWDVSKHTELGDALLEVYHSQNMGGARYDLATTGRRRANATYFESHGVDIATQLMFAMDLTELMNTDKPLDVFVEETLGSFQTEVLDRLKRVGT